MRAPTRRQPIESPARSCSRTQGGRKKRTTCARPLPRHRRRLLPRPTASCGAACVLLWPTWYLFCEAAAKKTGADEKSKVSSMPPSLFSSRQATVGLGSGRSPPGAPRAFSGPPGAATAPAGRSASFPPPSFPPSCAGGGLSPSPASQCARRETGGRSRAPAAHRLCAGFSAGAWAPRLRGVGGGGSPHGPGFPQAGGRGGRATARGKSWAAAGLRGRCPRTVTLSGWAFRGVFPL